MQKKIILSFVFTSALLISIISGCSSGSRYKFLSVFFDGVPNPNEKHIAYTDSLSKTDTVTKKNLVKSEEIATFHPPYKEKQCESCHDKNVMGKLIKPQPDLCYDCHEDFSKKYAVLHGPVISGYCSSCHNPHSTNTKKLLIRENQAMCLYCHELKQVLKNEVHSDIKETACTECHNPHGGEDRTILK